MNPNNEPEAVARGPEQATRTNPPLVSVVIPTYNRATVLPRAIKSVLAQSFQDFEVIIVDDGSIDDTRAVVDHLAGHIDGRLRYLHQEHANVSAARNRGVANARGEYIAFLDSDDEWLPEKLGRQVECLNSGRADWVHTNRTLFRAAGNRRDRIARFPPRLARSSEELLSGTANVAMTVMARRDVLHAVGPFDEALRTTQDLDLWLRVARRFRLALIDAPLVNSYKLPDSNFAADPARTYRDRVRVIEKLLAEPHPAIGIGNWRRLKARQCWGAAREHGLRRRHSEAFGWLMKAIAELASDAIRARQKAAPMCSVTQTDSA